MKSICRENRLCTGCTACASICPKQAVTMRADEEGFQYPVIDERACINCGLCEKTCPVNNSPELHGVLGGFVCRHKDESIVLNSTSGGTATALAEYTFAEDGMIFGAGYDDEMHVRHFGVDRSQRERIAEIRGSKYVQSNLGNCFKNIKKILASGKLVCFTGTPCQVAGLQAYLKKDYKNLLLVDLVCHGVSSPMVFKKYIQYQESKNHAKIVDARFRNKTYGYHSGTMMLKFDNGNKYYGSGRIDYMLKAYFSGACSRQSCYHCPFKGINRCSDLTVFDSWHIERLVNNQYDDDKGYTNILVHTTKGTQVIEKMKKQLNGWTADVKQMHILDGTMIDNNPEKYNNRENLIKEIDKKGIHIAMQGSSLRVSYKDKLLEKVKALAYFTGVLKWIKK